MAELLLSKGLVLNYCLQLAQSKYQDIHTQLRELQNSLSSETKSSVGDKHETARAKLHTEIDQLKTRQINAQNDLLILDRCQKVKSIKKVSLGSFIETTRGYFLIACGWGILEVKLENLTQNIFCISTDAPLFQFMKDKGMGDQFIINNNTYKIVSIT